MNTAVIQPRRTATLVLSMAEKLGRCATPLTKFQLFAALTGNGKLNINFIPCILSSIAREDGSGSSFNLIVCVESKQYRCYCRTSD